MLSLESTRWSELEHAYGMAGNVPGLLARLARDPRGSGAAEVWYALWGSVLHQGTVYPAALAVIPHLIAIAEQLPPASRLPFVTFVGFVASEWREHGYLWLTA